MNNKNLLRQYLATQDSLSQCNINMTALRQWVEGIRKSYGIN